ncbi:LysM peptidoglycan-binding domain-containing protein [Nesterenkonia halotolerans]|uniref:LysM peptidoglycan-binding domain-containing protein n=1 Tax=Nesterenkonia halotolerans TaxID=225325 RepID=UPI003EE53B2C
MSLYELPPLETRKTAPNYTPEHDAPEVFGAVRSIEVILIHWWDEPQRHPTFDGTVNWLAREATKASAHRIVEDGRRARMVDDMNIAWHAGPANVKSLSIEGNPRRSDGDYAAVAAEVAVMRRKFGNDLPLAHHYDYMSTTCSGYDLARVDREARAYAAAKYGTGSGGSSGGSSKPAPWVYTVKAGDTLARIAAKYDTSVQTIARLSDVRNPNRIKTGQELKIPSKVKRAPAPWVYRVKSGDTLSGIADKFGFTTGQILRVNDAVTDPDRIKVGQKIKVPSRN